MLGFGTALAVRTSRASAVDEVSLAASYRLDDGPSVGRTTFPGWNRVVAMEESNGGAVLVRLDQRNTSGTASGVARLGPDGRLDPTFGAEGPSPGSSRSTSSLTTTAGRRRYRSSPCATVGS